MSPTGDTYLLVLKYDCDFGMRSGTLSVAQWRQLLSAGVERERRWRRVIKWKYRRQLTVYTRWDCVISLRKTLASTPSRRSTTPDRRLVLHNFSSMVSSSSSRHRLSRSRRRAGSSMRLVRLKPQGPGLDRGPDRPVQRKLGPEISREKICGLLKFLSSGISIRPAVLPQFTPRLTNQL